MTTQTITGDPAMGTGTASRSDMALRPRARLVLVRRTWTDLGTAPGLWLADSSFLVDTTPTASCEAWEAYRPAEDLEATTPRRAVSELRRVSGLTWEQVAQLFSVSRRSVHFWASGKLPSAENEQRLMQILDVVRRADCGDARRNRHALLQVNIGGQSAFKLLQSGQVEEARTLLGSGSRRRALTEVPLSAEARAARRPLPPESLAQANHDTVHREPGRTRSVRTVRNKRRGPA